MTPVRRFVVGFALFCSAILPAPAVAQAPTPPPGCAAGSLASGAYWLICMPVAPGGWNGQLVVYAPGYRVPQLPKDFYQLTTPDGVPLYQLVPSLGYAFATTSYRRTGLVIADGVDDVRQLVAKFKEFATPTRVHLAGVSEGGLVATLLAEQSPELFSSALALCAPIGSFVQQIKYLGDFRVLFDYFFPGVIPGSPILIPDDVIANWVGTYLPAVQHELAINPTRAAELMRVSRVAYDPSSPATIVQSAINVLSYNVLGTNNARSVLGGGNPYSNRGRWYFGSSNDLRLNLFVKRFDASAAALAAMGPYETDGDLQIPLVTVHTTADEVAPFAHELLYLPKVDTSARGLFLPVPVQRYGHCNFTATEIALAFLYTANLP